jgi:ankyrin repeat protein
MLDEVVAAFEAGDVALTQSRLAEAHVKLRAVGNTVFCVATAKQVPALARACGSAEAAADAADEAQAYGQTPLTLACSAGDKAKVAALLAVGARLSPVGRLGRATPLHFAAKCRSKSKKKGGGKEMAPSKKAAAASGGGGRDGSGGGGGEVECDEVGDSGLVALLVAAGSDVNAPDHNGYAPLHEAAWAGDLGVIAQLVRLGAAVDLSAETMCGPGETPAQVKLGERACSCCAF